MESSTVREVAVQVCHYFKDFLETDFKRQQAPRRRIVLQSEAGFRAGMRVRPYPSLEQELWALLGKASAEPLQLKLTPRKHTRSLSPTLRKIVEEQLAALDEQSLQTARRASLDALASSYPQSVNDPELWIESACTSVRSRVGEFVVRPLIARLDGALQRSAYSVLDSLYSAESEMISTASAELLEKLPQVLARHLARRDDAAVAGAFEAFLTLEGVRAALTGFFAGFVTADALQEFRDLETYASITEGVQIYLYVGVCKFRDVQYPLFSVPLQVEKLPEGQGYQLTLVNQLFANRAAIDYVLQELAQAKLREWVSPIQDRINYLAPQQSIYEVARALFGNVANAMDLAGRIELSSRAADASHADVTLSTALHLCVFERGEEALVNDYEALIALARTSGGAILDLFEGMVHGILSENPVSIAASVDAEWDGLPLAERLVFDSPIPLNEEQRKVLLAVRRPEGRIVVVEGPPGTGKSHTITAIAADCAFHQKSCLILSDKAEALQVVQDKLSQAMNRVRHVEDFPNPLLRLGRQDANFKRLVANQTVNQVAAYAKAVGANQGEIEAEKRDTAEVLKRAIDGTVTALGEIPLARLQQLHAREGRLLRTQPKAVQAVQQVASDPELLSHLEHAANGLSELQGYLQPLLQEQRFGEAALRERVRCDLVVAEFAAVTPAERLQAFAAFEQLDATQLRTLSTLLLQFRQLRMPVIGYLFRGAAVRELERQLNALPVTRVLPIRAEAERLEGLVEAAAVLKGKLEAARVEHLFAPAWRRLVQGAPAAAGPSAARHALEAVDRMPGAMETMLSAPAEDWALLMTYGHEWLQVRRAFEQAPQFDYVGSKTRLERLNTSMMNAHVDKRLVHFMENHRADAKTLAQLISRRQQFPEQKFDAVRSSFPIIIASIREFGEYMPLAPELFDVVVVDEASQVSVAQALPAMLRARKVVVLGDSKQFSNVKSSNASIAINDKYRSNLVQFFQKNVRHDAGTLQRLSMFDVKRSVLEFCSLSASYAIMLRKHFRSYPELISYSSDTFYDHQLQAIKVRGVPVDEVIRFDLVQVEGAKVTRTANDAEAAFIEDKLLELLEDADPPTAGVITPFREQHTLLTKRLFAHARAAEFESKLRLKVMTFDSCQGEEREIVFYSMVATRGADALNYVFPVSLDNARDSVEDKLKVQRLNVGFSRAQEMIWFVHSMPLEEFRGSIGQALHHYARKLQERHGSAAQVDPGSPMEVKVLGWLQATPFVQAHGEDVEILPQFPIGDYLKQLDPTYDHPAWRVDFLITYRSPRGPVYIVLEYDGFEFHFQDAAQVHVGNHQRYLRPADVERQLTLESYGYRFLRINRFNVGRDPVATLDERIQRLVQMAIGENVVKAVDRLREQAEGIANKDMRQCTRCTGIKPLQGFFDATLGKGEGGYGRVCSDCKGAAKRASGHTGAASRRWRRRWT